MPGKLDDSEISARLAALPAWELRDGKLRREFRFRDFSDAFAFMTRVAMLAERYDHHPDWSNVYDRVTIELWSHDAGGITERDVVLAREISRVRDSR
jgi:4a-hydroxytetrahydrobiopterin dehydratase